MALKIGTVLDTAERLLRTDAFSAAAKDGAAKTSTDRRVLSKAEQEQFARFTFTYAGADEVRERRGAESGRKTAPAAMVYQTALKGMRDELGEVDRNADATLEWLDEINYSGGSVGALLHLAASVSAGDSITFEERLESLDRFFGDNDIDMGGGVWIDTGRIPQGEAAPDHALGLLKSFIEKRERSAEEQFSTSELRKTPVDDVAVGIRAAGRSIAQDGFAEISKEATLIHSTQLASLIDRMGEGVQHASASAKVIGESLQGETPVFAQVHVFFRPDGSYVSFSAIGGGFSRDWKPE